MRIVIQKRIKVTKEKSIRLQVEIAKFEEELKDLIVQYGN